MKPVEKKTEIVFRIISKNNGQLCGSYSRVYCDESDFTSVESARTANYYGMFKDKSKYKIAKYRVTYELLDDDCDNAEPIKPRPDGLPWDYDTFSETKKIGFLIGRSMFQDRTSCAKSAQQDIKEQAGTSHSTAMPDGVPPQICEAQTSA